MKYPFYLSVLIAAFSYGGEKCQEPTCLPRYFEPAYNYPARIETDCSRNIYTEMSFNYWQPTQENMELGQLDFGTTTVYTTSGGTTTSASSSEAFRGINMNFDFKPGFSIGIGYHFAHDDWDLYSEYTWFHNANTHNAIANNFILFDSNSQNISPTWGISVQSEESESYQLASEKWQLGMDLIDLDLGRWYYVGHKLTFHPNVGARAAFIRQNVHVSYVNGFVEYTVDVPGLLGSGFFAGNKDVYNTSHSWGVGPKAALETNWMLGYGLRLFGNGEADILYTRYTLLKEKTVAAGTVVGSIDFVSFDFGFSDTTTGIQKDADYLRAHINLELGFGWGTHFNKCKGHIDCSAGYQFEVYFDQNMFRHDVSDPGSFIPNGNLYINGLITTARLDF